MAGDVAFPKKINPMGDSSREHNHTPPFIHVILRTLPTMSTTFSYTETINAHACKYLLSLTADQFKTTFCSGDWKTGEGEAIARDVRTYHREVKKFCHSVLKMPNCK